MRSLRPLARRVLTTALLVVVFLGHNVINKRSEMGDFLDAINGNPAVLTTIVSPSGEGMSVSLKLR